MVEWAHLVFLCHQFDNYQIIRTFALSKLFTKIYGKRNPTNEAVQSDKKQIS